MTASVLTRLPLVPGPSDEVGAEHSGRVLDVPLMDIVEEWGLQSFPASDPPANW